MLIFASWARAGYLKCPSLPLVTKNNNDTISHRNAPPVYPGISLGLSRCSHRLLLLCLLLLLPLLPISSSSVSRGVAVLPSNRRNCGIDRRGSSFHSLPLRSLPALSLGALLGLSPLSLCPFLSL